MPDPVAVRRLRARTAGAGALALVVLLAVRAAAAPSSLPAGDYRLEMELVSRVTLPMVGEIDASLRSVSAAAVRWADGVAHQEHRVCAMWDGTAAPWGGVSFPPAFVAALAPARYRAELAPTATETGYRADLGLAAIGVAPGAPALPRHAGGSAVRDFEGDGRPGGTLRLRVPLVPDAELWVVQRARAVLVGRVVAPGVVEGLVEMPHFEQAVVGARPGFLRHTPVSRHDAARSRFRLEQVEAPGGCPPDGALAVRGGAR